MRAVIDTSVLISGMLSNKSYPARVLDGWNFHKFEPVVSPDLAREYAVVLTRKRFDRLGSFEKRAEVLQRLFDLPWVTMAYPQEKIDVITADRKDNMILECAVAGKARYIVTGDNHLLDLSMFRDIEMVNAQRFIEILSSAG
ncbi:nucleotide-binding protein [Peptococcaceae bacterium SCADC1_2_3]|jgi:hypothetical protein|nr:nucleotide-binding protein [Peptococcaceae bacterium SCADC1_2_3]KFI34378.1 nucleotide-binding protein [Peptococcaceae bacterium SCADC1_2_3]KFI35321.1 nucleotide-binding protein [Peptococcaceae bacterium SCADC1_2_3]KFI38035.1 nucleotide-binding protein [Peptococcaceae bacterium SCADC1_2_3]HBQ28319.1 putative toxin-antitoxin system toxin component, PIN family [Desulfotomaculum sp.]